MKENYPRCLTFVLKYEGGLSLDRNDPGNWTGGKIGLGSLRGTKYGIAASAHPTLDIRSLTVTDVAGIYKSQYWDSIGGDLLASGADLMAFDISVNSGAKRVRTWLAGCRGMRTVDQIAYLHARRMGFWKSLVTWARFGRGWTARETACRALALEMIGVKT